jgi:hypothetical protein
LEIRSEFLRFPGHSESGIDRIGGIDALQEQHDGAIPDCGTRANKVIIPSLTPMQQT